MFMGEREARYSKVRRPGIGPESVAHKDIPILPTGNRFCALAFGGTRFGVALRLPE
jgi:hypothetical protein